MLKFLNPGNTNGSAAVGVLANCLSTASNRMAINKRGVLRRPTRTGTYVNCLSRRPPICPSVAIQRCLGFVCSLGEYMLPHRGRLTRVYGIVGVRRICGHLVGGLSGNCGRHMNVTRTLVNGPPMLVLSRPAMNLSPGRVVRVHSLVGGLNGRRAVVLSDRVLSRVRTMYSHIIVVGNNGVITSSSTRGLSTTFSSRQQVRVDITNPTGRITSLIDNVNNMRGIAMLATGRPNIARLAVSLTRQISVQHSLFLHLTRGR